MSDPTPDPDRSVAPGRRRRMRSRRVLLIAMSLIGLLVVGVGVGAGVITSRLNGNIERIGDPFEALPNRPAVPTSAPDAIADSPGKPLNILVVGSDSRVSAGDPSQWAKGGQRTDAIMILHLPADRKSAYLMSIPRDSWVDIPGHGTAKVNAAFSYGGPALLIQTIEQLTQVRIDHLAISDFESFTSMTDALGGVQITVPVDTYRDGKLVAAAGTQLLDGAQALTYVRERYTLARGDFDRVQRQQNWMRAIFTRAASKGTLTSPTTLLPFLDTVTKSVAVDDGFTLGTMRSLAVSMRGVRAKDVTFFTVPVAGTGRSPDGRQSIVNLNRKAFDELMVAVANDKVAAYLADHSDDVDTLKAAVS
ncbi:LCP family protein [Pengzhenrongella sp.]|jgi:LCP family protein required for cell wall assembly|uniref:LCP family protein n=1 Tax=Pengzhenrongella sp. TaxID=2888820 RepID=UPI002F92C56B